jgi:glycosyltransferase involved in cell wall biosynthesis
LDPAARTLLFVGDARLPAHGGDRLIAAIGRARELGADVDLTVVSRPGQEPPPPLPPWVTVVRAEADEIVRLLPSVRSTVIPRPRSPYNDLAVPIKLMEYLSYGRPMIVTDCTEQARIVRQADAGIVVGDEVNAISAGIMKLMSSTPATLDRWARNAAEAALDASWEKRARAILAALSDLDGR